MTTVMQLESSLRAERSNPALMQRQESWIASSLSLLAMTVETADYSAACAFSSVG
jgi:hypothetical protein